jgi:hypothetical protein
MISSLPALKKEEVIGIAQCRPKLTKVFWFFFSKKNCLPFADWSVAHRGGGAAPGGAGDRFHGARMALR